jgi:hypothetical protein
MTDTSPKIFDRWRIADAEATAAELALNERVIAALDGDGSSIVDDGRSAEARTLRQIADALFALAMAQLEAARSK